MKNDHLTDETLQAYLLKEIQDDTIATHLTVCTNCREKFEKYQHLIVGISKIAHETFSFDLSSIVMEKIYELETQKERNKNNVLYISLSIASIVALVLLYPYIKIIFNLFKSYSIMANIFILISVLGVVIFLLSDLFRQYKQKEMLLSQ
jgi:hypothetical protein